MSKAPLKLRAQDAEDLQMIAALLQDAIAPVCDMLYRPEEKSFIMTVHRFCWDGVEEGAACFERVHCALDIDGVEAVQRHGFDPHQTGLMLDLLTLNLEKTAMHMVFAGDRRLKLTLGAWQLRLRDFGEPWPTTHRPSHAT